VKRANPLHRALALIFAAPAMSLLAAEPADPPQDAPTKVAQAQAQSGQASSGGSLEKIEVSAQREHYRGDVAVEDLPQAVQVISGETLKLIGAVKINEALDIATGVARQNVFGGLWDGFAIRGFVGDPNLPSGYLVNGFNGGRGFGGIRDTSAVEKMEILRGPASSLFGRSEPGGTVSITTKKPQFKPEGSATLTIGSDSFYRGEADYTAPIGEWAAFRINGAYEDADSFRDTVHTKREFASPSILFKLSNQTSMWYELEWSRQEIPFDRGVVAARNGDLGIIPNSRFLAEPGDGPTIAKVLGHQAELQHNFAKDWVLLVGAAFRTTELNGIGQNPELAVARQPYFTDGVTLSRQRRFTDYESDDFVGRAEISGLIKTGSVTHHLLTGADYEKFKLDRLQTRYRPPAFNGSQSLATMNAVNIFNPVYGNAPAANQNVFNDTEDDKSYGIYLTDQMDLTDTLKLRLGGRYDWFEQSIDNRLAAANAQPPNQDVTAFSPQVGLTWRAFEGTHLYTTFAKGFRPQTGFDVNRNPFEPEETKSGEVGVKYETPDGNLSGTVALFNMEKTNVLTADPVNAGQTIAIGKAKSKGVEVDLFGRLPWQSTIMLSYAYTDAYSASDVKDVDFARVVSAGDPLINIPKHNASALLTKDIDIESRRLTLGGQLKYVSKRLGETGTTFFLPSYTLLKLFANYEITKKLSVAAEVSNVTDKVYYPASYATLWIAPGAPRQFQLRTTYRFF
jgi:iron complex outermembrane receptor protein